MRLQRPIPRRRLVVALLLLLVVGPLAAQERATWTVANTIDSLTFYVSRVHGKSAVIAVDAAHYAFVASRGPAGYIYVSDDTASTLELVRTDQHPVVHYDLAHPTVDDLVVVADSVDWGASGWEPIRGMFFRSSDRGATWDTTMMPEGITLARVAMVDADEGIAATTKSATVFYRTTDGWRTWTEIAIPTGVTGIGDLRAPAPGVYVINGTFRTTDAGSTWNASTAEPPDGIWRFRFLDAMRGWAVGGLPMGSGGDHRVFDRIARTTDGGTTWSALLEATEPRLDRLLEVAFADALHGIATGKVRRVMSTTDGGITWSDESLPDSLNEMLELTSVAYPTAGIAVAVANGAILRRVLEPATRAPEVSAIIRAASAAPNPAAAQTVVDFTLTSAADVAILVVDAVGETVATIDAGARRAGANRATLDLGSLPSGGYTVVIDAGGARPTLRMTVAR